MRSVHNGRASRVGETDRGVNGTPTFLINGVRFDGAWDAEASTDALPAVAHRSKPSRDR
jgi:hypothetical protein